MAHRNRAQSGAASSATPRGYVLDRPLPGLVRTVACLHSGADMERELQIMVDNGCTVLDVIVEHPVYGQLTGGLGLASRYDIQQFIRSGRICVTKSPTEHFTRFLEEQEERRARIASQKQN